jgi:HD-GYP domain-containing protein (c-di-GMP phosphodiesterase class II)
MIKDVGFLKGVAEIIRHHHERYDGKGYPAGLAGEDIPLGARILACADAFDAMTSDRVYRRALSFEQAKTELIENRGKQFDPRVIEVFLKSEKEIRAIVSREHKEDEHIC